MKYLQGLVFLAIIAFTQASVLKTKALKSEDCEGTVCPAGCCPEQNWFCCSDNQHCAATESNCPFVAKKALAKMAAKKDCEGTVCPAGCCPEQNWFCCSDNLHWLPRRTVKELSALLVAARSKTGSAVLTTSTVLLLSQTAPLLPKRLWLRWLPRRTVREPCALLDAARSRTGSAVLTTSTVLPLSQTVLFTSTRPC